jgi:hypothetical protein
VSDFCPNRIFYNYISELGIKTDLKKPTHRILSLNFFSPEIEYKNSGRTKVSPLLERPNKTKASVFGIEIQEPERFSYDTTRQTILENVVAVGRM